MEALTAALSSMVKLRSPSSSTLPMTLTEICALALARVKGQRAADRFVVHAGPCGSVDAAVVDGHGLRAVVGQITGKSICTVPASPSTTLESAMDRSGTDGWRDLGGV